MLSDIVCVRVRMCEHRQMRRIPCTGTLLQYSVYLFMVLFCLSMFEWTDGWTNKCLSAVRIDGGGWDTFGKTTESV